MKFFSSKLKSLKKIWFTALILPFFSCNPDTRLLVTKGTHTFEGDILCKLENEEPKGIVNNLNWDNVLAIEADREGKAEIICGNERFNVEFLSPSRLDIEMITDSKPELLIVQDLFKVQIRLYNAEGKELEVGKFTNFEWSFSDFLELANDNSSGEFGICDTCYGMHSFQCLKPGKGFIKATFGNLEGEMKLIAEPH